MKFMDNKVKIDIRKDYRRMVYQNLHDCSVSVTYCIVKNEIARKMSFSELCSHYFYSASKSIRIPLK